MYKFQIMAKDAGGFVVVSSITKTRDEAILKAKSYLDRSEIAKIIITSF